MTSTGSSVAKRNEALDFVKGILVLIMVVYHWLNYFVTLDWDLYRYLRFLTPSFILITGFLVSHVYLARFACNAPDVRRRLIQRGLKLILLFVALNVLAEIAFGYRRHEIGVEAASWLATAKAVFIVGDNGAAFSILLSIGYFLLIAPILLMAAKRTGISLATIAVAAMVVAIGASLAGHGSAHLEMLSVAVLGLAAGAAEFTQLDATLRKPLLLVCGYVFYLAAITIFNVPFPLQVAGVCLSVLLIYAAGVGWAGRGLVRRQIDDLGKYSLLSYVVQIAVLQLLRRSLRSVNLSGTELLIPFAVGLAITVLAVQAVAVLRIKSVAVDRLYRTVFA